MREGGVISNWNPKHGYGFITPKQGSKNIFVHKSSLFDPQQRPKVGERVSFVLDMDRKGRPCAKEVRYFLDSVKPRIAIWRTLLIVTIFFLVLSMAVLTARLPSVVLLVYLFVSILSYINYARDKRAAVKGASRIRERLLQWYSLLGGWPGAMLAQQSLRHKSIKETFRRTFRMVVGANLIIIGWVSVAYQYMTGML